MKSRLDKLLAERRLVASRSQAESYIRLGKVRVDGSVVTKAGTLVEETVDLRVDQDEQYVSRAGLKLASVAQLLGIDFSGAVVLDVGSSTGGFTDYALRHGARLVYAVDVGTDQLHPSLRSDERIEIHEKTDIRDFVPSAAPDIVVIDVSFISLCDILPHIATIIKNDTKVVAMAKPQFEAASREVNKGVIKNDTLRREILKRLEEFLRHSYTIVDKADSEVAGAKGNRERFYVLKVRRILQKK